MDALGVERASLVGNSLGGGTALRMALDAPGRVSRLVLMGTGGSLPLFTPYPTEGMQRIAGFYEGEGPTLEKLRRVLELLVFDQTRLTDELVHERFAAATRPDVIANPPMRGRGGKPVDALWREPLGSVTQSTLLLWGREDRVMPLDAAFVLLKALPLAELHVFPQCGHWVQWEQAARFNALVSEFLDAGGGTA
jgi:4,5:9,10-diseco-3-hydroxy-5,9,17-trioxoandrosta-1(10),2-diene-4-oate hydrolase